VATLPDVSAFRSARDLSAWLGLTPKPHASGSKDRLGTISKMGALAVAGVGDGD
jgi:transposase